MRDMGTATMTHRTQTDAGHSMRGDARPGLGAATELEMADGHHRDQIGIVIRRLQHGIVLAVAGEIDLATAPIVERALRRAEESHDLVAIDLSRTSFMDSTGLHVIMAANLRLSERGGRLVIIQGPPQVNRIFELTGLSDHLDLVRDETELERFGASPSSRKL
jgi:anti-anti-sigma factor